MKDEGADLLVVRLAEVRPKHSEAVRQEKEEQKAEALMRKS